MATSSRSGTVLIIVVGIASIILVLSAAFFSRMRSDGEETALVVRDGQARIMLTAALQYLQETSRLGWQDPDGADRDEECWGWTDVRDGSLGPRGPRNKNGKLPVPGWWRGSRYPDDDDNDPHNESHLDVSRLPGVGSRRWPCPGSAMRGNAYVKRLPPYAVRPVAALNPVTLPSDMGGWIAEPDRWAAWRTVLDPLHTKGAGMYDPQPVADDWSSFRAGIPDARPETTNLSWFRCYRELPTDHDADGRPWYDRVPLSGHGAFIIACGAGSTMGYRFWSTGDDGFERDLEPETAEESGLFPDKASFEQMRASERVLWFRAEWTAFQGGGVNVNDHYRSSDQLTGTFTLNGPPNVNRGWGVEGSSQMLPVANTVPSFFGCFKWIERLEKDPGTW